MTDFSGKDLPVVARPAVVHGGDKSASEPPGTELRWQEQFFRHTESMAFKRLPGFSKSKGHFVPERASDRASDFASRLLVEELQSESKEVYRDAKKCLGLKSRQINRDWTEGSASVECEVFRFDWVTGQDPEDPGSVRILRTLRLSADHMNDLPDGFDALFPVSPDELVVPMEGALDYDDFVDHFEDVAEDAGGWFEEDEDTQTMEMGTSDGVTLRFDLNEREMTIVFERKGGLRALVTLAARALAALERESSSGEIPR